MRTNYRCVWEEGICKGNQCDLLHDNLTYCEATDGCIYDKEENKCKRVDEPTRSSIVVFGVLLSLCVLGFMISVVKVLGYGKEAEAAGKEVEEEVEAAGEAARETAGKEVKAAGEEVLKAQAEKRVPATTKGRKKNKKRKRPNRRG